MSKHDSKKKSKGWGLKWRRKITHTGDNSTFPYMALKDMGIILWQLYWKKSIPKSKNQWCWYFLPNVCIQRRRNSIWSRVLFCLQWDRGCKHTPVKDWLWPPRPEPCVYVFMVLSPLYIQAQLQLQTICLPQRKLKYSQLLNIKILKFNSPVLLNLLSNNFPYCPAVGAIRRINSSNIDLPGRSILESVCLYSDSSQEI